MKRAFTMKTIDHRSTLQRCSGILVSFLLLALIAFPAMAEESVAALVADLAGPDECARVRARQLLPYRGGDSVPLLAPLLAHEDAQVWWAADKVIRDVANTVAVPGREAECALVAEALLSALAPDSSLLLKERVLKIIPVALPEGAALAPVAALLQDPVLAEKARVALLELGTDEAGAALCAALDTATPAFQAALLRAVARLDYSPAIKAAASLTKSESPLVRAAAARVVAASADMQYLEMLWAVRKSADEATAFDATDAYLRLVENAGLAGGQWPQVMAAYRALLADASDLVQRSGALVGLGRFGDERVLDDILTAVRGEGGRDLEPAAAQAMSYLQGANGQRALVRRFDEFPPDLQYALLGILAQKNSPEALTLLLAQAESGTPVLKRAAVASLVKAVHPGVIGVLEGMAQQEDAETVAYAREQIQAMAPLFVTKGDGGAAGKAYLASYRVAQTEEERAQALEGIKSFPVPEAFDVFVKEMPAAEMEALPLGVLAGIAKAMYAADRKEEAEGLVTKIMPRLNTTAAVGAALDAVMAIAGAEAMLPRLGFVTQWQLVGPFPWEMGNAFTKNKIGEPTVDLRASYPGPDASSLTWKEVKSNDPMGLINLMGHVGALDKVCVFAYTVIQVPEATEAVLGCGSDDGIKVWVNEEAVHENNIDRGVALDQDKAPIKLLAGENRILVQCTQNAGGWNFLLRLMQADGSPLLIQYP